MSAKKLLAKRSDYPPKLRPDRDERLCDCTSSAVDGTEDCAAEARFTACCAARAASWASFIADDIECKV